MTFKELELENFNIYKKFFKNNVLYKDYYGSELNFKVIYLWQHFQKLENYICADFILTKGFYENKVFFLPPLADSEENFVKGINLIKDYCQNAGIPVMIKALTPVLKKLLLKHFAVKEIVEDRNLFEYIYLSEDLIKYEGKKYHNKKNLLHQFEKYDFKIERYSADRYDVVMGILNRWNGAHSKWETEDIAMANFLKLYEELDLVCELMFINGKPEAFIAGTICENNLGMIIFEKANAEYKGIYAALNSYFVRNNFSDCKYVSMQEDMGVEGLRKSKNSYNPVFLEEKYIVYF